MWTPRSRWACLGGAVLLVCVFRLDAQGIPIPPNLVVRVAGEIRFGKDGAMMRRIPTGSVTSGADSEAIRIEEFYLDVHEVTTEQYLKFCMETGMEAPEGMDRKSPSEPAEVTWYQAGQYAKHYGKKLPTASESEWANRCGKPKIRFPWGDDPRPPADFGNLAGEEAKGLMAVPEIIAGYRDGHSGIAPVASYRANPWGLYDLCGNAVEWTREFSPDFTGVTGNDGGSDNDRRVVVEEPRALGSTRRLVAVMGGDWRSPILSLECSVTGMWPENSRAGFRCTIRPPDDVPGVPR